MQALSRIERNRLGNTPRARAATKDFAHRCTALLILLAAVISPARAPALEHTTMAIAVADFDYRDTSGEIADQTAQHAERVHSFANLIREELSAQGKYRVVALDCEKPECSITSLGADGLVAAARHAGTRLLVYGGIHKMSTLVQWGEIEVVDLQRDELLLRRTFTFRGDTDLAFRQAAGFVGETLEGVTPKP